MSLFQALVLAVLQGVTELFPVSSLGHTVILPKLLGWNLNQADPTFLAFVVLLPGIPRSGSSMVAGLLADLTHEAAARFAFLLATPIIFGAGVLKIPDLFTPLARPHLPVYLLGGVAAGVAAFLSVAYLMRYFRVGRLDPFATYCAGFGIVSLILLSR